MDLIFAIVCVITILFCVYWQWITSRKFRLAEKIGGPRLYLFVGNLNIFFGKNQFQIFVYANEHIKEKMYRLWLGFTRLVVVVTDPELVEIIMTSRSATDKGIFYELTEPVFGNGLIAANHEDWQVHRKIVAPSVNALKVKSFIPIFAEESRKMVEKWKQNCGIKFEQYRDLSYLSFCIPLRTAIGEDDFKKIPRSEIEETYLLMRTLVDTVGYRFFKPWLHNNFFYYRTSEGKTLKRCLRKFHTTMENLIKIKMDTDENDDTYLGQLVAAHKENPHFTNKNIMDELKTYIFAAFDSSSTTLTICMSMLGCHPELQEEAYKEQLEIFGTSDRVPTLDDINKMDFLERFIRESGRIFPSVPMVGREIGEDLKVGDKILPKGAFALFPTFNIQRDPSNYPNPLKFNPDNFLPENIKKRHPYAYLPFGGGPRSCIGQKYAILSMKTSLSNILRNFYVKTDYKMQDMEIVMNGMLDATRYSCSVELRT